jgi:hypothetical protein
MTDELEAEERRLLGAAYREYTPGQADAERVLARTLSLVTVGAASVAGVAHAKAASDAATVGTASGATGATVAAAGAAGMPAVGAAFATATALPKLATALALLIGAGGMGYGLGYRAAERGALGAPAPESRAAMPEERSARQPPSRIPELVSPQATPDLVEHAAALGRQAEPPVRPRAQRPRAAADAERTSVAPLELDDDATPSRALRLELSALRKAERALRDERPRVALAVLAELERDVPEGTLVEERAAATSLARCALGLGAPAHRRAQFVASYPRSVYRARVEVGCPDAGGESP